MALTLALSGIASISVFGGAVGAGGLFSTADSIFELAGWAATGGASIVVTGGEYANTSVARDPEGDLEVTVTAITGVGLSAGIDAGMSYTWVCEWHGCDDAIKGYVQEKFPSRPSFEWRPWKW